MNSRLLATWTILTAATVALFEHASGKRRGWKQLASYVAELAELGSYFCTLVKRRCDHGMNVTFSLISLFLLSHLPFLLSHLSFSL